MSDYTKKIHDLSSDSQKKIKKDINTYIDSYTRKVPLKESYDRHLSYFNQNKKLSLQKQDFYLAFKAKNFWKDLSDCGSWLEFRWYRKSDKTKLHTANFCKRDKLCVSCAVRRAYKQQIKFLSILEAAPDLKDCDWYYIVLPVKHNKRESLETVLNRVSDLRKKITISMRNARRSKKNFNFWSDFQGGMFAQEVTKTKNGWNVHLNILVNASKGTKINLNDIKNRRGQISHQNEDLRQFMLKGFDSQMHNIQKLDFSNEDVLRSALVEILKYSLKFSDLTAQNLLEVFVKTRKIRLFGTFGNLWGKGLESVDFDKDIVLDEDFVELIFTRTFKNGFPDYKLYKREVKKVENPDSVDLVHTFGIVVPNISKHKKYYSKVPLILVSKGGGRFNIRSNGIVYGNNSLSRM